MSGFAHKDDEKKKMKSDRAFQKMDSWHALIKNR